MDRCRMRIGRTEDVIADANNAPCIGDAPVQQLLGDLARADGIDLRFTRGNMVTWTERQVRGKAPLLQK